MRATVHTGPKGGTEYRLWTDDRVYRVVSRFRARPFMDVTEQSKADEMEAHNRAVKLASQQNEQAWREIMRGG